MSRSYKHTPYSGDRKGKSKKRNANHIVRMWLKRHPEEVISSMNYRKLYERYDICDYYDICPYSNYIRWKEDEKSNYLAWYKAYQMK